MGDQSCVFCKIIARELPSEILFENDNLIAIRDIQPMAPVHLLILPKKHITSLLEAEEANLLGEIQLLAAKLAKQLKLDINGFRVVNNCGQWGGQTVFHLHYHLLGGRILESMG